MESDSCPVLFIGIDLKTISRGSKTIVGVLLQSIVSAAIIIPINKIRLFVESVLALVVANGVDNVIIRKCVRRFSRKFRVALLRIHITISWLL